MSPVTEWNQRRVLAHYSGEVADNMHRACDWVADQAQQMAPRRSGLLAEEIAIGVEIEARDQVITGWVGVKKGKGDRDAFYGFWVEMGRKKAAAHPFLRPAVFGNGRQIVRMVTGK